jgi:cell volume regulation protein A
VSLDTSVRGFHSQMAFMVKSFFFVFIGAMLGPPWGLILIGVLFAGVLLGLRIPAVRLSTLGGGFSKNEQDMATVSMPRGMAAGVLATLPAAAGIPDTEELPVVVFACVFTTILIFAVGFPIIKKRLSESNAEPGSIPLPAGAARPSSMAPPGGVAGVNIPGTPAPPNITDPETGELIPPPVPGPPGGPSDP